MAIWALFPTCNLVCLRSNKNSTNMDKKVIPKYVYSMANFNYVFIEINFGIYIHYFVWLFQIYIVSCLVIYFDVQSLSQNSSTTENIHIQCRDRTNHKDGKCKVIMVLGALITMIMTNCT
jgi:hypothetical protein